MTPDESAALKAHNDARAKHHLKPLQWDANLANKARQWAQHLAATGKFEHSTPAQRPSQGENLFGGSGRAFTFVDATNSWLSEGKNYHGQAIGAPGTNLGDFGHYTQCLWRSTTHVGMGSAKGANGWTYVVGRYSPPGNFTGQKPY